MANPIKWEDIRKNYLRRSGVSDDKIREVDERVYKFALEEAKRRADEAAAKATIRIGNAGVVPGGNVTKRTSENSKAYKGRTSFVEGYGGGRILSQDYAPKYEGMSDADKITAANNIQKELARRDDTPTSTATDSVTLAMQRLMGRDRTKHELEEELGYLLSTGSPEVQASIRQMGRTLNQNRIAAIDSIIGDKGSTIDKELRKRLKEERGNLVAQNTQYERFYKRADDSTAIRNNPDYMLYSTKRPDIGAPTEADIDAYNASVLLGETPADISINDKLGFYLNTPESERTAASERVETGSAGIVEHTLQEGYKGAWDELEPEEINDYYYIFNTEGKEAAEQYLLDMEVILSKRRYDKEMQYIGGEPNEEELAKYDEILETEGQEAADEYLEKLKRKHGWKLAGASIASIPGNIVGGAFAFADDVIRGVSGRERNPYSTAHILQNRVQGIREATTDRINEGRGDFLGLTLGDVYQAGMSMGESMLGSMMGGGGNVYSVFMGMGAAASTAKDLYEQGASEAEIASVSMLAGAAEFVFEKIGIDNLLKSGKNAKGVFDIILDIFKQGGVEGMEEGATEIANILTDAVIRGSQSGMGQDIQDFMADGDTRSEAVAKAVVAAGGDVLKSAAMGMMSGAGSASIYSSINGAQNIKAMRQEGADIIASGNAGNVIQTAQNYAKESVSSDAKRLGKQADRAKNLITDDNLSTDRGKRRANTALGRLAQEMAESTTAEKEARIKRDLIEKGSSRRQASQFAKAAAKEMETGEMSRKDLRRLLGDENAMKYHRDVISNENSHINALDRRILAGSVGAVLNEDGSVNEAKTKERVVQEMAKSADVVLETNDKGVDELRIGNKTEEVEISEIVSIADDGKKVQMKLKLSDGRTVDAKDISFGSEEAMLLYEGMATAGMNVEAANALIRQYHADPSVDVGAFLLDVMDAYTYGRYNFSMDELLKNRKVTGDSLEAHVRTAYDLGRSIAESETARKDAAIKAAAESKPAQEKRLGSVTKEDIDKLNDRQRASVRLIENISKLTGIDFYIFESRLENGERVYTDENGEIVPAVNGFFDPNDNSIHIDVNAGSMGDGLVMYTAAHELAHFIKKWSPAKFKVLADFLVEKYGEKGASVDAYVKRQQLKASRNGRTLSYDAAFEEFVADSMETMLTDTNAVEYLAELKQRDESLWNKIKSFLVNLVRNIKRVVYEYRGESADTYEGRFVQTRLSEFADQIGKLFAEGLYEASERYQNSTVDFDAQTESVAPKRSERTWTSSEYVQMREKTINAIVKDLGVSKRVAAAYIDDINSIAALIADDRVRLDYEPNVDASATVLKANSEYKYTVDMSTLCSKRLLFTGTFDAIQREMPNKAFTSEEIVELREMMVQKGLEVACGICYVESTRREIGAITQEFIERYKAAQKSGKPISRINSKGAEVELKVKGKTFLAEKGYTPTLADLNTTDIDLVKRDHRDVYDAYLAFMNARGQAKPKLLETRAEYKGEVLKHFKSKSAVKARNDAGGLRLQSFSDFEVPHMIDMMQVVMDMSRVGLKSQAYTKVPVFAEVFGDTGVKINLSLIAKGNGLDANGQLIFDDVEGINHEEAFRLREKFSKNVGTILVGKNDAHIIAAMADPRIDYIIPFHKSSWKESLYDALGLTGYDDYTSTQNEKYIDKSRGVAKNFAPSEYWDYSKTGDENAQIYLEKCRQDGRIPKFPQFQGYPGYWKLLIDFKMYDNDGVGSPQEVVRPQFEMDAAKRILDEYKGGHRTLPVAKDVVSEFVEKHKADERKYSARDTALDKEYMDAVNRGDMETAQRMVDEAARRAEYPVRLFHGTNAFGFTRVDTKKSSDRISFFATDSVQTAGTYSRTNTPRGISDDNGSSLGMYQLYANADGFLEFDAKGAESNHIDLGAESSAFNDFMLTKRWQDFATAKQIAKYAKQNGYPGVIIRNVVDTATVDSRKNAQPATVYVFFNPQEQVKSADPVTYDDKGNVIPLSERFNAKKEDIRYQARELKADDARLNNKYSYESLVAKPDMKITKLTDTVPKLKNGKVDKAAVVVQAKKNAADVGRFDAKTGSVSVEVSDIGTNVILATNGLKHSMDRRLDVNAPVVIRAGEILRDSIRVNELTPQDQNASDTYVLIGMAANNTSDRFLVRSVVNRFDNNLVSMDVLYAINAKKELAATRSPRLAASPLSVTNSTISIREVLEYVNDYFPEILSESALRHFGHNERPAGKMGEYALYQSRSTEGFSNRAVLVNALESSVANAEERELLQRYKKRIQKAEEAEEMLSKVKAKLKEMYFAEGYRSNADKEKLMQLEKTRDELIDRLNRYDRNLTKLESTAALKELMKRERESLMRKYKTEAKTRQMSEREQRGAAIVRSKIARRISNLNRLLNHGDKKRNVKEDLKDAVGKALEAAEILFRTGYVSDEEIVRTMDASTINRVPEFAEYRELLAKRDSLAAFVEDSTVGGVSESSKKELDRVKGKISRLNKKLKAEFVAERKARAMETVDKAITALYDAYSATETAGQEAVRQAYDPEVLKYIDSLKKELGGTVVQDMSKAQLEKLYEAFTMIETSVRKANKFFADNITESREQVAMNVIAELRNAKKPDLKGGSIAAFIRKYGWNNEKPIYAMRRIGSNTLTTLYENVRKGEDVWAVDVYVAREFARAARKEFRFKKWKDSTTEHVAASGEKFELNLEQRMSLYAYSRRPDAIPHLKNGGFQFDAKELADKKKAPSAVTYNLTDQMLDEIQNSPEFLTKEQRDFVHKMQAYLSDVMGAKGNEVSMAMYGVKLYTEETYFPLKVSGDYNVKVADKKDEVVRPRNYGFTHKTVPNAKDPIILTGFSQTWSDHVGEMSMYHAFTLPMEDFLRTFSYNTSYAGEDRALSVRSEIINAYGQEAADYITQLMKDLSSGVRESREYIGKKLTSKFKKAAVMASGSVVIQQFSAIGRALAVVDSKYFIKTELVRHKALWEELKKYAPVAVIKEMGRFDTNMGRSTSDYLMSDEYEGFKEKFVAFFKDSDYRDDILSKPASYADELTWCRIWNAVKRETLAKRKAAGEKNVNVKSEAFLNEAGARFTEVVERTQVYDSVFSKSANMRAKTWYMDALTSFMAEPTTTLNMVLDAFREGARGNKGYAARTIGAAAVSIIMNAMLSSLVYAARDDDEDETFAEKYLQSLTTEMIDGFNLLTYLPFIKDIWSVFQGYDVERSDLSLVTQLVKAGDKLITTVSKDTSDMSDEQLAEHKGAIMEASWGMVDYVTALFGIPVKNIRRDVMAAFNAYETAANGLDGNATSTWSAIADAAKETIPLWSKLDKTDKSDKLYDAIKSGDTAYYNRIAGTYKDDDALHSAIRKTLRENDSRIREAAVAKYEGDVDKYTRLMNAIIKDGFEQDDVVSAIKSEYNKVKEEREGVTESERKSPDVYDVSDYLHAAMSGDTDIANTIKTAFINERVADGDTIEDAENAYDSSIVTQMKNWYMDGKYDASSVANYIVQYTDYDQSEAETYIKKWDFELDYGYSWDKRDNAYRLGLIDKQTLIQKTEDITGDGSGAIELLLVEGDITESEAISLLREHSDIKESQIDSTVGKWMFKKDYGYSWTDRGDAYIAGVISASTLMDELMNVGDKSESQAELEVDAYDWMRDNPGYDIGLDATKAYIKPIAKYNGMSLADTGLDVDAFMEYRELAADCEGVDKNNDGKADNNSVKNQKLEVIDSLPITSAQKDALYFYNGWARSGLSRTPWH